MKRTLPHILSILCGLSISCMTYCALDLLIIIGMALERYPRFSVFLAVAFLLSGIAAFVLAYLTLRLWNQYESKRWMVILYTAEAAAVFLPGMWACEKVLAWLQRMF